MRLGARLQSTKEKVECEEIVTANILVDNVIEIFVKKKEKKVDYFFQKIICVVIMRDID